MHKFGFAFAALTSTAVFLSGCASRPKIAQVDDAAKVFEIPKPKVLKGRSKKSTAAPVQSDVPSLADMQARLRKLSDAKDVDIVFPDELGSPHPRYRTSRLFRPTI